MFKVNEVLAHEISEYLNLRLAGKDIRITQPSALDKWETGSIVFVKKFDEALLEKLNDMPSVLALASKQYEGKLTCPHIICDNARLCFLRVLDKFFYEKKPALIDPTALVCNRDRLGENVSIGAYSIIDEDVTIGDNTFIGTRVTITGEVVIGRDCWIKSGAVIGEEGFGFEPNEQGEPEHFPQIGKIIIGDRVFIGANSTVEMAALSETRICDGVKIDDLVQIGHNTFIGKNSMIMSGAVICGGAKIGESCWIAPNSSIRQNLTVGDNSVAGLGAVVITDIPDNKIFAGNPAKELKK